MAHFEVGCGGSAARQQGAPVVRNLSGTGIAQQEVNKHVRSGRGQVNLCLCSAIEQGINSLVYGKVSEDASN